MSEVREGFYWHVHHDVLLEWCYDEQGRRDYIKQTKSPQEIERRLRLFRRVRGSLPDMLVRAQERYARAREEYVAARKWKYSIAAWLADDRAAERAWLEYNLILGICMPQVEALHRQECPDCPWDGITIFPTDWRKVGRAAAR